MTRPSGRLPFLRAAVFEARRVFTTDLIPSLVSSKFAALTFIEGIFLLAFCTISLGHAEVVKIGINKAPPAGPIFIAQEKGYFAAEGLAAELVFFDAAPPVATAVVSGSIDFGVVGFSAGFFSLAGQGALRVIAGSSHEAPGFHSIGFVVSNAAFAAGLKTFKDIPGHSVAIAQVGAAPHYSLGLIGEKFGFALASVRLMPLQTIPNEISAVVGNRADVAAGPATALVPLVQRGSAKLLGWVGDETPWQLAAIFTATKTTNERREMVERFIRAYRKAVREYHDAFTSADGQRRNSGTAAETTALLAKSFDQSGEEIDSEITYFDADARLDVKDVLHQIAWYKSQGMLKSEVDGEQIIDTRYVLPLP